MGTAEIAALLGVSRQRVLKLAGTPGFPAPLATLTMGNVWDATRIRAWATGYRPRTRKPDGDPSGR